MVGYVLYLLIVLPAGTWLGWKATVAVVDLWRENAPEPLWFILGILPTQIGCIPFWVCVTFMLQFPWWAFAGALYVWKAIQEDLSRIEATREWNANGALSIARVAPRGALSNPTRHGGLAITERREG